MSPLALPTTILTLLALCSPLAAAPQTFDFKDPKGVNTIVFRLDAPLESISGTANDITGSVEFDPANPASIRGRINVATASMQVRNPMMQGIMLGEQWMDAKKHPELNFEVESAANVRTTQSAKETQITLEVTGKLTLHGITRPFTVPVHLTYLQDALADRMPGSKGDLLILRSTFKAKRSDFGINPAAPRDKVSDAVELILSLAGTCARP